MTIINGIVPHRQWFREPLQPVTLESGVRVPYGNTPRSNDDWCWALNPYRELLYRNTGQGVAIYNPIDFVMPWFGNITGYRTIRDVINSQYLVNRGFVENFFCRKHMTKCEPYKVKARYRTIYPNVEDIWHNSLTGWLNTPSYMRAQDVMLYHHVGTAVSLENQITPLATYGIPSPVNNGRTVRWSSVQNYSYAMNATEYNWYRYCKGEDPNSMMIGVEMEVDTDLSGVDIQSVVQLKEPEQEPFFILKQDGSISNRKQYGYEIVTVPMTPKYFKGEMRKFFSKCDAEQHFNQDNSSIGMHIHVNKKSFSNFKEYEVQQGERKVKAIDKSNRHLQKFLMALNPDSKGNTELLQMISLREARLSDNAYCRPSMTGAGMRIPHRWKEMDKVTAHASACAITPKGTVEVRIFQNVMNLQCVTKNVEFVESVFDFTRDRPIQWFGPRFYLNYKSWLKDQERYRTLRNWMTKEGAL